MVFLQNVVFQTLQKNITALSPIKVNVGSNKQKLAQWDSGSTLSILYKLAIKYETGRRTCVEYYGNDVPGYKKNKGISLSRKSRTKKSFQYNLKFRLTNFSELCSTELKKNLPESFCLPRVSKLILVYS